MGLTFFWNKVWMWNQLLLVVYNDYHNPLSKRYSIRYQLVLLVDWLKLVGTRSNEVERNLGFFHVDAPPSSTWKRPGVRGRSWLVTFAHLAPLNKNAPFFAFVNFSVTSIDCYVIFFIMFRCIRLEFRFHKFVPQSVRVRVDRPLHIYNVLLWSVVNDMQVTSVLHITEPYILLIYNYNMEYRICRNKRPPQNRRPPKTVIFQRGKYTKPMGFDGWFFKGGSTQNRWALMGDFSKGEVHKTEKSPIKAHRFCVLPPLKNHPSKPIGFVYFPLWWAFDGWFFKEGSTQNRRA